MSHHQCPIHGCHHHGSSSQGSESSCCCSQHHEGCEHHESGDFSQQLLEMADEAWMELLKEKVKKQIEATGGSHLDQLAKLIAESNNTRWKHKLAAQKLCHDYKEKIAEFFNKG